MDHSSQLNRRLLDRRRITILFAGLVLAASLLVIFQHARGVRAAPVRQTTPPQYNWYVCEDLGIGSVPGLPGMYQRLRLCHPRGWQVLAYCLEPNIPPPPLNTTCSRITADTFWCGDLFQLLRQYELAETPTPAPTDTLTPVPTQTNTSTPTSTPLPSATASPSPSPSPSSTQTSTPETSTPPVGTVPPNQITVTAPPGSTNTAPPPGTPTDVGFGSTPTPRPVPGGDGVLPPGPAAGLFVALLAIMGLTGWVTFQPPARGGAAPVGAGKFMVLAHFKAHQSAAAFLVRFLLALVLLAGCRIRLERIQVSTNFPGISAASAGAAGEIRLKFTGPDTFLPMAMAGAPAGIVHRFSLAQVFSAPSITTETAQAQPLEPLNFRFAGIDFNPGSPRIALQITPPGKKVNQGEVIMLSFLPGSRCYFGDGQACVNSYRAENGQPVIYLTIHSGVGGQGQAYRHAVEGTGLNRASNSLDQVQKKLKSLQGASVTIQQGEITLRGLILAGTGRVPGAGLHDYFSLPVDQGLSAAAAYQPRLKAYIQPDQPLLVFETCGWRMPDEAWSPGTSATSASVYLGVIQAEP